MLKMTGLIGIAVVVIFAGAADAHTLRLQCKKISTDDVVCRALFSDGEVARGMAVRLYDENAGDKVLQNGKTDVKGEYAFKVPNAEYSVVIQATKSEVASLSSEDIW